MVALRTARLPLPRVPTDAAGFRRDERPTPGPEVAGSTQTATNVMTGLLAALAAVVFGGAVGLLIGGGGWAWTLAGLSGLALLLRARAYAGVGQRGALLLCGGGVLAGTGGRLAVIGGQQVRLALIATVLLIGVVCVTYAVRAVRNVSSSPYWTRLLDIVEVLALASLVPVAAMVVGVYGAIRAWGG
jgi:type VII secretion integral membrane protein EccD